jgi:hypothetical protein
MLGPSSVVPIEPPIPIMVSKYASMLQSPAAPSRFDSSDSPLSIGRHVYLRSSVAHRQDRARAKARARARARESRPDQTRLSAPSIVLASPRLSPTPTGSYDTTQPIYLSIQSRDRLPLPAPSFGRLPIGCSRCPLPARPSLSLSIDK